MPTYGRIEEFKFENNFEEYTERLEEYFLANEIDDDDKKRSIFLTVCGEKTYSLLRNLCAPAKPNTKTFDNLKEVLTDHLRPKPLIIAERYKFHQRKQESHEKVRDYLANLRKLADTCQFNAFLEEALRDRLVCGLYSKTIQRKLLSESELDLKKAFEIAVGIEAAEKETNEFRNEVSTTHKVTMRSSECYRCGKSGHYADSCFYKNSRCHKCKEIGHISRKCRKSFPKNENQDKVKKQYKKNTKFKAKPSKVHQIEENSESEPEENSGWEVFTVKTCRTSDNKELKLDVKIEDVDYVMELDTGAAVSIIGEKNKKYSERNAGVFEVKKEEAVPKFFKPRPIPYALRDKVADEIKRLEKQGILEKIKFSEWGAPIVPVMKPDGSVRICGDYKVTINSCLEVPQYPLPKAEDLFSRLNGGKKFSKLDLSQAYQQLLLCENSRNLVTINTHLGLYRYTRLPFGAASSPAIFQEFMDKVLEGLDGVGCILDDLIITGKSDEEHLKNLELVLKRLSEYGLRLKKSKCSLMKSEVEYFAFIVNKDGIQPSPKKVEAMLKVPELENVKELQSWLGLVNYYRKFIPDMSTVLQPLNELLTKKSNKLLSSTKVLAHYDPNVNVELAVDASPYGLGCVISHKYENGEERPIAYASRTLTSAERNYSQIEREALAIIFGVTRFHQYLYGRKFTLITDNKPLSLLLGPKTGIPMLAASRIQRWAIQLSGYQYDVKCKSSSENANADGLSRLPLKETLCESPFNIFWEEVEIRNVQALNELPVSANNIKEKQKKDSTLVKVKHATLYGWPKYTDISNELKPYFRVKDELSMEEGCLLRGIRVIIPERYRADVLNELHVNHPELCA
ncbi:unnamed protein product [Mytilus coruscus]|uniref:Reverse transcriptase n=1 Tax=Mytilus coruscus TaxID=42192 RepID=A0A6J8BG00_MYTCO|nr:unnamed protein product [Mytilus coruscus]